MNLPKYTPRQVVIILQNDIYKVDEIHSAEESGPGWVYTSPYVGLFPEHHVTHVLNGDYWVPADQWSGPVLPNNMFDRNFYDKMLAPDPDEEAWLNENVRGKEEDLRKKSLEMKPVRKIEVKDGGSQ